MNWLTCKVPVILVRIKETRVFSTDFWENPQIPNLMKIRVVGAKKFHADRRKDGHMKLTVALRNFANAPTYGKANSCMAGILK